MLLLSAIMIALMGWWLERRSNREEAADQAVRWHDIAPLARLHAWRWIVIHHSGTDGGSTAAIDLNHAEVRGWEGIGYHFVIGNGSPMPLGRIEATFRWRWQHHGAHAGPGVEQQPYNRDGIGICLIGNYDRQYLDPFMEQRLVELCTLLIEHVPTLATDRIIGHRQVPGKATECPGRHVDISRLRALVAAALDRDRARAVAARAGH